MKTIPAAFLVALVAFVLFPLNFEIAGSLLFVAGFAAIVVRDYGRLPRPLTISRPAPVTVTEPRRERFGLAA